MSPTSEGEGIDYRTEDSIEWNRECYRRSIKIDVSMLPESLRHLVKNGEVSIPAAEHSVPASWESTVCECGAKHTSNPSWHMNFCPLSS